MHLVIISLTVLAAVQHVRALGTAGLIKEAWVAGGLWLVSILTILILATGISVPGPMLPLELIFRPATQMMREWLR